MDADANRSLAHFPTAEAGRPGRALVNFQPGVTEATASAVDNLIMPITVAEACEHSACDVRARHANLTEEATCRQPARRAAPTEAGKGSIGGQINQTLFCRLTPELSRPVAGWRTRASVAQSTWPTPRHGVGLNELLGPCGAFLCMNEQTFFKGQKICLRCGRL